MVRDEADGPGYTDTARVIQTRGAPGVGGKPPTKRPPPSQTYALIAPIPNPPGPHKHLQMIARHKNTQSGLLAD